MIPQPNIRVLARLESFSRAASAAVILAGGLVLAGWRFDVAALKSILPGLATMKANTALAFVLSGVSLLLLGTEQTGPARRVARRFALACAVVVALLGLFTLSQDLFGWELGIDQLLFEDSAGSVGTSRPGRMSEVTAFNLLMIGCALLLLNGNKQRGARSAQLFAIAPGLIALLALVGYAYSVQTLYDIGPFSSIALHTALTFFVLSLAILCLQPDRGLTALIANDTAGGVMLRRLLPAAIAAPFLLGWLRLLGEQAGLYDARFGVALFALANIIVFTILIWSNARALERADLERRQAKEALRETHELLQTVIQASPLATIVVDANGAITVWNPAAERLLGWSAPEVLGRPIPTLPADEQEDYRALRGRAFRGETVIGVETRHRTKDGLLIDVSLSLAPLSDSPGKIAGMVAIIADITRRKQVEETLRQQAEQLARSNKELEQFAYVASHDLQEPLRIVSSYVQLLARRYRGKLDSEADEFIAFTVEGANRMKALINDLLAYSRVGTRGKELAPVAMDEIFDRAVSNLQLTIQESGASVTHDPLPQVVADDQQMVQLLQNLIGNAVKFRSKEPSRVHIGARQQDEHWLFFVRDNGIGLDPKYAERIFIIFQRLHSRDEYPGTGIGLAICHKIVERHGGRIWAESKPGKGATFYFTLRPVEGMTVAEDEAARQEAAKLRAKDSVAERATDLI